MIDCELNLCCEMQDEMESWHIDFYSSEIQPEGLLQFQFQTLQGASKVFHECYMKLRTGATMYDIVSFLHERGE